MEPVRETEKKYCSRALTIAIFISFILMLAAQKSIGKGLLLGTLFSILNFILIGETLPKKITNSSKKAFFLALGSIVFRYVLMAVPLFVGIRFDEFNLFAVILGIFMVQLMILADHFSGIIFSTDTRKKALWKN